MAVSEAWGSWELREKGQAFESKHTHTYTHIQLCTKMYWSQSPPHTHFQSQPFTFLSSLSISLPSRSFISFNIHLLPVFIFWVSLIQKHDFKMNVIVSVDKKNFMMKNKMRVTHHHKKQQQHYNKNMDGKSGIPHSATAVHVFFWISQYLRIFLTKIMCLLYFPDQGWGMRSSWYTLDDVCVVCSINIK